MKAIDLKLYSRTLYEIRQLLNNEEKLGISNLPDEFNGIASDMLYDEGVENQTFVLFVDALVQECNGKSDDEILKRFKLVERVLTTVYERNNTPIK